MDKSYLDRVSDDNAKLLSNYSSNKSFENGLIQEERLLFLEGLHLTSAQMDADYGNIVTGFFKKKIIGKKTEKHREQEQTVKMQLLEARFETSLATSESSQFYRKNEDLLFSAALINARGNGVEIVTQDDAALGVAEWQHANTSYDTHPLDLLNQFRLDQVSKEKLLQNARRLPEFAWNLPNEEVENARKLLMATPMTHSTTSEPLIAALRDSTSGTEILPHRHLSEQGLIRTDIGNGVGIGKVEGFTFGIDKAMGLDEYVFLRLGVPYVQYLHDKPVSVILLSPQIMLDERCIVTSSDVMTVDVHDNVGVESQQQLEAAKSYRDSAILGKDWVEVMARRLAKHKLDNPKEPAYPVYMMTDEVKFHGPVPRQLVLDVIAPDDYYSYVDAIDDGYGIRRSGSIEN